MTVYWYCPHWRYTRFIADVLPGLKDSGIDAINRVSAVTVQACSKCGEISAVPDVKLGELTVDEEDQITSAAAKEAMRILKS